MDTKVELFLAKLTYQNKKHPETNPEKKIIIADTDNLKLHKFGTK